MNFIKNALIASAFAMSASSLNQVAVAEEAQAAVVKQEAAASPVQTTIAHIEMALGQLVGKQDLSNAQPHIKAALDAAKGVTGDSLVVKQAWDSLVNGRIETKRGNVDIAINSLNEAVRLYKTL